MHDLIRRQAAIDRINNQRQFLLPEADERDFIANAIYKICAEFIERLPSADRPSGEWFKDDEGTFICSACGSGYKDQPTIMGRPMFEYCPMCGAKMRGW